MEILFAANRLTLGGAETHLVGLARVLQAKGHTVTVVSAGGQLEEELTEAGISHYRLPLHKKTPLAFLRSLIGLSHLLTRHSFLIAHAHGRIPAVLLRLLQKKHRFRFVTTAHLDFPRRGWGRFSAWGESTLAVSQDIKDHLIRVYRLPPDRIAVTVNGIDTAYFAPRPQEEGFQIVHVSRLDHDRSMTAFLLVSLMPELLRRYPEAVLTIIGEGDRFDALRKQAKTIDPLGRHLRLRGGLSDIRPDLEKADLFIGVSRAALEAMACGIPTILSGNQGFLGLLTPASLSEAMRTNLCCRGQPLPNRSALLKAITEFFVLPSTEKQALRSFGRQTVLTEYPFERTAEDYLSLYASLPPRPNGKDDRILLIGYFGYGNTGDEAILDVELTDWRRLAPTRPIIVLSARPAETACRYGVTAIGRFSPLGILRALRQCRTVVFGGGGLLQDSTSKRSLVYYTLLLWLATRLGKEIRITANGVGPITSPFGKRLTAAVLKPIPSLTVRDRTSETCLRSLGYTGTITRCADPATRLPPADSARLQHLLRRHGLTKGHYLLVAPKGHAVPDEALIASIARRAAECRLDILLLPLFPREDLALCRRLCKRLPRAVYLSDVSPREIRALISCASEVIAMRWHALLFASESGVPFYTVAGDFKTESFLREQHYDDRILFAKDPPYLTHS